MRLHLVQVQFTRCSQSKGIPQISKSTLHPQGPVGVPSLQKYYLSTPQHAFAGTPAQTVLQQLLHTPEPSSWTAHLTSLCDHCKVRRENACSAPIIQQPRNLFITSGEVHHNGPSCQLTPCRLGVCTRTIGKPISF